MRAIALLLLVSGCGVSGCGIGFADDASGGKNDLPSVGAGPYRKLAADENTPADEPWLVTERTIDFTEPAIVARAGGGFTFFVTRESPDPPVGDSEIWRGAILDPTEIPDEPIAPVLTADAAWEEGHVAAPSIVDLGGDRLLMFYEGGLATRALGRAESSDGGHTWTKSAAPVLTDAALASVATDGALWLAAFTRPGPSAEPGIFLARSDDGLTWVADTTAILLPSGIPDSFEEVAVSSPHLAWLEESTGRGHWALWYGGLEDLPDPGDAPRYAVGYAASFDGMDWDRLGGGRPVLSAPAGAPTVIVDGPRATLLFDAANGRRLAVGVALHP
ncbi:MAG TPA: sialidase family protein [Kofleriaceae bacterium]|nr:sialidase family protein [Kofleriaceae bacterium]